MTAFILKSDKEFITPYDNGEGVKVCTYKGDVNDIKIMRASYCSNEHWADDGVEISATGNDDYDSLEVFGTTIAGDKLKELCKELEAIEEAGIFVYVNRLGLCVITELNHSSIKAMRINDYFGWSKYGVKVPHQDLISSSAMWNKFDMFSGETMLDVEGLVRAAGEVKELRRSLEEEKVKMAACKKEMEEKKVELAACKKELEAACKKKNVEMSACKKKLEEKNVELAACKKELEEKNVKIAACKKKNVEIMTAFKKKLEEKNVEMTAFKKKLEEKNVELVACNVEMAACEKELDEKNVELAKCKNELEERNMEMVAWKKDLELSACMKELEWLKKNELLWRKLVEEKEKVDELMKKNNLLSLSANDH